MSNQENRPEKGRKLYEHIIEHLQEELASRRLKPGDRLPTELGLARQFGVSRASVREALRVMESMSLIECHPGSGTFVKELEIPRLLKPFTTILAGQKDFLLDSVGLRLIVEPGIASLAAEKATPEDILALEAVLATQQDEIAQGLPPILSDEQFHTAIAEATHNIAVTNAMHMLNALIRPSRTAWIQGRGARTTASHTSIVEAIRARDPERARAATIMHLKAVEDRMIQYLSGELALSQPRLKADSGWD